MSIAIAAVATLCSCGVEVLPAGDFEYQTAAEKALAQDATLDSSTQDGGALTDTVLDVGQNDASTADVHADSSSDDSGTGDSATSDAGATDSQTSDGAAPSDGIADSKSAETPDSTGLGDASTNDASGPTDAMVADAVTPPVGCKSPTSTAPCDDGDACTFGEKCSGGLCLPGKATVCDDQIVCTADSCDPKLGCVFNKSAANGQKCDADGTNCTVNDACTGGNCAPGKPKDCSDGKACTADLCDDQTASCSHKDIAEGEGCDDGAQCTVGEACTSGSCGGGVPKGCDDANSCTKDACFEAKAADAGGCKHEVFAGSCTDDGPCTLEAVCLDGSCIITKTGIPKGCDDNNVCTKEACSPSKGCVHLPVSGVCSDSDACTSGDVCTAGSCVGAPLGAAACDDKNPCTKDQCTKAKGCVSLPLGGSCNDANACTVFDTCNDGQCAGIAVSATSCSDDNLCTEDSCDAAEGCVHPATHGSCDDGNLCTSDDVCGDGTCAGKPLPLAACDDTNPCTADGCEPKAGCTHSALSSGPCEDGDDCTATGTCSSGTCVASPLAATAACDDGNSCTTDNCPIGQDKVKCTHAPAAGVCSDNNACTGDDTCKAGACVGLPVTPTSVCDDGNPCTRDRCEGGAKPGDACVHDPLSTGACTDNNACTTGDLCNKGGCVGLALDVTGACDDGNPCTRPLCSTANGCANVAANDGVAGSCDDGNSCSLKDACAAGACKPGPTTSCDDGNACTVDSCAPKTGCQHAFSASKCDDADACTAADSCVFGQCSGTTIDCDDGNACTADSCDASKGCVTLSSPSKCDDGDPCTGADVCTAGKCGGTTLDDGTTCADSAPCQLQAVCKSGKCAPVTLAPEATPCDDGLICTVGDACNNGTCSGSKRACDDGNACTADACNPKAGCVHTPTKLASSCSDDGPCKQAKCDAQTGKCGHVDLCANKVVFQAPFDCDKPHGFTVAPIGDEPQVGWHVDGTPGNPGFKSPKCSLNFNDGKDYGNGKRVVGTATSPTIALPHSPTPTLVFWSYHGVELHPQYDLRFVEVSDDGFVSNIASVRLDNGSGFGLWTKVVLDLRAWRRKLIQVRFRFDSADASSNDGPGWFIDDLEVEATLTGGSCQGHCGAYRGASPCQCDVNCALYGDCCVDVQEVCGGCQNDAQCNVGQACAAGTCDTASGSCVFSLKDDGSACNDSSACTTKDRCQQGICAGDSLACDDGNSCTADACQPKSGNCTFAVIADGSDCDDGDACTGPDKCVVGKCSTKGLSCDDGNSCTANGCDKEVGCTVKHLSNACEDGSLCTKSDQCSGGICKAGDSTSCDDNNACTVDSCVGATGKCEQTNQPDATVCGPGSTCVAGKCSQTAAGCGNGKLDPGEACDDGGTKAGDGCDAVCQYETPKGMTAVPAGAFWMGCNAAKETCEDAAKPQHKVELSAFYIDIDEVSVAQYQACIDANKCSAPNPYNAGFEALKRCNYKRSGADQHPVNCVDHSQAAAYCAWVGGRLPTEAEWEKAARGGCETLAGEDCKLTARVYPWGSAAPTCKHAVMQSSDPDCGGGGTLAVGNRDSGKSPYGARDLLGNVAEWVADWYDKSYYSVSVPKDPQGPADSGKRGFRGGAFDYVPSVLRASMRFNFATPTHRASNLGFRCARTTGAK